MSDTAATQLRRLLALIPRLADGSEHPVEEVAALAGVSREMLIADLEALVDRYDTPGGFVDGVQVFHDDRAVSVLTQHFNRPMRLTAPELCALELGLCLVRNERAPDEVAPVDRALERLRDVITNLPSNDIVFSARLAEVGPSYGSAVGVVPAEPPPALPLLRKAVRGRRKVALSYMKGSSTTPDERTIRPYSLAFASGAWYVIAFCERTEGLRVFRVDRVVSAEWAEGEFDVPSDFSPGAIVAEGRAFSGDAAESVRIRYSPKVARWVAEREGLELAKDGSLEVEHPLADPEWAVRHVLQYGGEAEVVGPEAVRWRVVTALQALVAPHRPSQDEHE